MTDFQILYYKCEVFSHTKNSPPLSAQKNEQMSSHNKFIFKINK